MSDESQPTTPSPESPPANTPEARTPTGEIKDQQTAQADGTTTPTKPAEPPKSDAKSEAPAGAPESYADFAAPEGFEINKDALAAALPVFKDLNLTQDQAQRLVDIYAQVSKDSAEAPHKAFEAVTTEWRNSVIRDPKLGNGTDGLKPEVQANINRAVEVGGPEMAKAAREAMDMTGGGNNPAIIGLLNALGARLGEGSAVTGKGPSAFGQPNGSRPRNAAQALFPNLPSSAS